MINNNFTINPGHYGAFAHSVYERGNKEAPREVPTRELINATAVLENPLCRVITSEARKMNPAFAIAEFISTLVGIDDINFFTRFIKSYGRFSTNGVTLDGCYGTRVNFEMKYDYREACALGPEEEINGYSLRSMRPGNQIIEVIEKLQKDDSTRRAVVSIYDRYDTFGRGRLNTPCTLTLQFLLRDGYLHLITNMRSSDIIKGITYDMFVFTMIQEFVARRLGVDVGHYYHNAGSLHAYETDKQLIQNMLKEPVLPPVSMPRMPKLYDTDIAHMKNIALGGPDQPFIFDQNYGWSHEDAKDYVCLLLATMFSWELRYSNHQKSFEYFKKVRNTPLNWVLALWLESAWNVQLRS